MLFILGLFPLKHYPVFVTGVQETFFAVSCCCEISHIKVLTVRHFIRTGTVAVLIIVIKSLLGHVVLLSLLLLSSFHRSIHLATFNNDIVHSPTLIFALLPS